MENQRNDSNRNGIDRPTTTNNGNPTTNNGSSTAINGAPTTTTNNGNPATNNGSSPTNNGSSTAINGAPTTTTNNNGATTSTSTSTTNNVTTTPTSNNSPTAASNNSPTAAFNNSPTTTSNNSPTTTSNNSPTTTNNNGATTSNNDGTTEAGVMSIFNIDDEEVTQIVHVSVIGTEFNVSSILLSVADDSTFNVIITLGDPIQLSIPSLTNNGSSTVAGSITINVEEPAVFTSDGVTVKITVSRNGAIVVSSRLASVNSTVNARISVGSSGPRIQLFIPQI